MPTKKIIFLTALFFLSLVFYYLKLQSSQLITSWYETQNYEWLNRLSGVAPEQRLGLYFYLGQIEERVTGPLTQLISGLLFAGFALLFLPSASREKFGLAVFAYLLLTKLEVLLFPPYGDAIGGPFAEALWLKENNFNYAGLAAQPGYAAGGPKVYVFSLYPTYLALLMKLLPDMKTFLVVNHLAVFAMAAAMAAVFRDIAARAFSREVAVLLALVLLYLPLFQSQTEAINMEIPCAFFMMLSAGALIQKKAGQACLMAIMAIAVKGIGVLAGAAVLTVSLLMWLGNDAEFRRGKVILWLLVLAAVMAGSLSVKYILKDQHVSAGMVNFLTGWPSLKVFFISRLYVWSLFLISAGFILGRFFRKNILPQKYDLLIMLTFGVMWFLLFLNFYAVSPRYRVGLYPFLIYTVFYAAAIYVRPPVLRILGLTGVIIAALFYSYGRFEPPMTENDHVQLERSLEYRNDLKLNQLVVKTLEDKYDDYLVGAPFTIAQLSGIPGLGYAQKKLEVMIYGFHCSYGGIKNYPGMDNLNMARTVYVGVKTAPISENFAYPIGPRDQVVQEIEYGNKKAWLFMGGVAIEMLYRGAALRQMQKMRGK